MFSDKFTRKMCRAQIVLSKVPTVLLAIMLLLAFGVAPTAAKTVLTFWNGFTGPDRPAIEHLVAEFNRTHPDIEIKMDIMPWDTLMQKLLTSMLVAGEPDIAGIHFQYLPQFAKSGVIAALDDLYASSLDATAFPPALAELMSYNGKMYAVPMNFATLMLYYNKGHFRHAGLDPNRPPATWDEWFAAIRRLTVDEDGDGKPDRYGLVLADHQTIPMWPILVWGGGGDFVSPDGRRSMLDHPKTIGAFQAWVDFLLETQFTPVGLTGAEADKLFESGRASMEMNGPWMTSGYARAGLDFDVAPIPAGPAGRVTLADSVIMVLNRRTKNAKAAYEFFTYWNAKVAQRYHSLATGFPPTRVDMADDPDLQGNPFVPKFASVAPYARFYLAGLEEFAQIDTDIIIPAIQRMTRGLISPAAALKDAADQMNRLLQK